MKPKVRKGSNQSRGGRNPHDLLQQLVDQYGIDDWNLLIEKFTTEMQKPYWREARRIVIKEMIEGVLTDLLREERGSSSYLH